MYTVHVVIKNSYSKSMNPNKYIPQIKTDIKINDKALFVNLNVFRKHLKCIFIGKLDCSLKIECFKDSYLKLLHHFVFDLVQCNSSETYFKLPVFRKHLKCIFIDKLDCSLKIKYFKDSYHF